MGQGSVRIPVQWVWILTYWVVSYYHVWPWRSNIWRPFDEWPDVVWACYTQASCSLIILQNFWRPSLLNDLMVCHLLVLWSRSTSLCARAANWHNWHVVVSPSCKTDLQGQAIVPCWSPLGHELVIPLLHQHPLPPTGFHLCLLSLSFYLDFTHFPRSLVIGFTFWLHEEFLIIIPLNSWVGDVVSDDSHW